MVTELQISELTELSADDVRELSRVLIDVVQEGASIGFLPPLQMEAAQAYWTSVLDDHVKLWVAKVNGVIVGTVQLHLVTKPNGTHRAEIAKLLVHPTAQRRGVGRSLMINAESRARVENRSLLVLDTREGDPSNSLYRSLGYEEAGRIPYFAQSAEGHLDTTVLYYKRLV